MKIKSIFTWELDDIEAGLYVIKNTSPVGSDNLSFARTVIFKVIYSNQSDVKYGLCNCLTDGWVRQIGTKEQIVEELNSQDYRPLTKEEYIRVLNGTNQGFLKF